MLEKKGDPDAEIFKEQELTMDERIVKEKEDEEIFFHGLEDLHDSSFVEKDFIVDEFSDLDPLRAPENDVLEKQDEVQYLMVDFYTFCLFLVFFFFSPD
jgi:hypothetical protein